MQLNLHQFILGLSYALDLIEVNHYSLTVNHSNRVAYLALRVAEKLRLSDEERLDLCFYAVLHDNGMVEEKLLTGTNLNHATINHWQIGQENVAHYPFLSSKKRVILYHHEKPDGSGLLGVSLPFAKILTIMMGWEFCSPLLGPG